MRIAHIQPMRELKSVYATRLPVAFALAASILSLPAAEIAARSGDPGDANAITGSARVIDGDTISIGQVRIRLEGIDAPEVGQTCQGKGGASWPCGSAAATALEKLIAGKPVRCDRRGLDKYGRTLAVCFVRGRDVNADMVRQGLCLGLRQILVELREGGSRRQGRAARHLAGRRPRPPGTIASGTGTAPKRRPRTAAPSRATSPRAAASTTCPGAPGTPRSE